MVGFVGASDDARFDNAAIHLEGGEILHRRRRVHPAAYRLLDERRHVVRHDRFRAIETRFGRVGPAVCQGSPAPSAPYLLDTDGAPIHLCVSNGPLWRGSQPEGPDATLTWERLHRTYARHFGQRVLDVHGIGFGDGVDFESGSMVIGSSGQLIARAGPLEETVPTARIDPGGVRRERASTALACLTRPGTARRGSTTRAAGETRRGRRQSPTDRARPSRYRTPSWPRNCSPSAFAKRSRGSASSGSSSARRLESRNVTPLAMPCRTAGPERLRHAREVTEQLTRKFERSRSRR